MKLHLQPLPVLVLLLVTYTCSCHADNAALPAMPHTPCRQCYDEFVKGLQAAGWKLDRLSLPKPVWTVRWGSAAKTD